MIVHEARPRLMPRWPDTGMADPYQTRVVSDRFFAQGDRESLEFGFP